MSQFQFLFRSTSATIQSRYLTGKSLRRLCTFLNQSCTLASQASGSFSVETIQTHKSQHLLKNFYETLLEIFRNFRLIFRSHSYRKMTIRTSLRSTSEFLLLCAISCCQEMFENQKTFSSFSVFKLFRSTMSSSGFRNTGTYSKETFCARRSYTLQKPVASQPSVLC